MDANYSNLIRADSRYPRANKKALRFRRALKMTNVLFYASKDYFFADVPRLNFEVNFSTRPAVSTRRFSPV